MDSYIKDYMADTTETFSARVPFGEKTSNNLPYISQIQDLMSMLITKKAELKEAKLRQGNLVGKCEQQDIRIHKIKISMEHEIEREQVTRASTEKLQNEVLECKEAIKEFTKEIKSLKNGLAGTLEDIIQQNRTKTEIEKLCVELQCLIRDISAENESIDEQIQNFETLVISSQNDARSKNEELVSLELEKTEIITLLDFLEEKLRMVVKAKNSCIAQSNDLTQQVIKAEQKVHNLKKETNESDWNCEQIINQNCQIDELNERLVTDLEGVRKHLATVEKMNQLLQSSLAEYGFSGDKVNRMIEGAKAFEI